MMEEARFDALARALDTVLGRRASVRAVLASFGGLIVTIGRADDGETRARRRRRRRRKQQRCASGLTFCDGYCVDLGSNFTNCGRCGRRCSGAEVCQNGSCITPACDPGLKRCNGICVDTRRDPRNCGTCGNACRTTQGCSNGKCVTCDVCVSGCAFSSIQDAARAANLGSTVTICAGTYTETLNITTDVNLAGLGIDATTTTIAGDSDFQAVVTTAQSVTLRNLTVAGSDAEVFGIDNYGSLTLDTVIVRGHQRTGVRNFGQEATLLAVGSAIVNNTTTGEGGGIFNVEGVTTLLNTRVAGNTARKGGGIALALGVVGLDGSTAVTGNTATGAGEPGGGVFNAGGRITLDGGAITGNTPDECVESEGGTGCPA